MTQADTVLNMARQAGVLRAKDARAKGIAGSVLARLVDAGKLQRVGRGLYSLAAPTSFSEHQSLVETALLVPHGVICLLSALRFHQLGTQAPFEVWIAIDRKARFPRAAGPPLHVVRFSGKALIAGIEKHEIDGVEIRVYSRPKTVADCFKYRNKIGLDVALEALRAYRRSTAWDVDALSRYARIDRVENVMRPYLEALV